MFIRVMFIVTVFHVTLLPILFIPLGIMLTVMLILIFVTLNRGDHAELTEKKQKNADLQSPFQIGPALKFAAFIVAVKFLAGWALVYQDVW